MNPRNAILEELNIKRDRPFMLLLGKELRKLILSEADKLKLGTDSKGVTVVYPTPLPERASQDGVSLLCFPYTCLDKNFKLSIVPFETAYAVCLPYEYIYVSRFLLGPSIHYWLLGKPFQDLGNDLDFFSNFLYVFRPEPKARAVLNVAAEACNVDIKPHIHTIWNSATNDFDSSSGIKKYLEEHPDLHKVLSYVAKQAEALPKLKVGFPPGHAPEGADDSNSITMAVIDPSTMTVYSPSNTKVNYLSKRNAVSMSRNWNPHSVAMFYSYFIRDRFKNAIVRL